MGIVYRNGRPYLYRSKRRGGRVTSEYVGSGHDALLIDALEAIERDEKDCDLRQKRSERKKLDDLEQALDDLAEQSEARQAAIEDRKAFQDRLDTIDRTMAEYCRRVGKAVEAMLIDLGFHRHDRGQWRRRRKSMLTIEAERYPKGAVPLTLSERLAERARGGDPAALESVLQEADRHHHESVKAVLLQALTPASGPPYSDPADHVSIKLIMMRGELAPPGSSAAEKLLAERATLCWLHLELLEYEAGRLFHDRQIDSPKAEIIDRRLARAQAQLTQALRRWPRSAG
jgi:hypothetical protein